MLWSIAKAICVENPLANLPGYALRRAASSVTADLASRLAPLGLRVGEAAVLLLIAGREDMTSADIGRILDIQRANMAPLLARLDATGLLERRALNRKSQAIVLSNEGLAAMPRIRAVTSQFEADVMARIPEAHRPHFVPALHALWHR